MIHYLLSYCLVYQVGIHVGDIFCTLESPLLLKPKCFQNFLDKIDGIKSVFSYDFNSCTHITFSII